MIPYPLSRANPANKINPNLQSSDQRLHLTRVPSHAPSRPWPSFNDIFRQCQEVSEGSCGIFEERTNGGSSKTDAIVPKVCGTPVGWLGAQTACGSHRKSGETFPDDYPYDCHRAARHGSFEQVCDTRRETVGSCLMGIKQNKNTSNILEALCIMDGFSSIF